MFDQQDYVSDEQDAQMYTNKSMVSSKVLAPNTGSQFNHLAGESQSLIKMMKERGLNLNDNEIKKLNTHQHVGSVNAKSKPKTGFYDGGDKASTSELIKALNKSLSQGDPQQASCILSYLLSKPEQELDNEQRKKFQLLKCNLLFQLKAYKECLQKCQTFLNEAKGEIQAAIYSNLMAKSKIELGSVLAGYIDFLRAKALCESCKSVEDNNTADESSPVYKQSEYESTLREINYTELELNIKLPRYKSETNLVFPLYPQFRHRKVLQVVCGEYHSLFLIGQELGQLPPLESEGPVPKEVRNWSTQVFGLGENTVGQVTGIPKKGIYSEPVLISKLSGKGIKGVWAVKESSLAYDYDGNIYEWGIKENRNQLIEITYTVSQPIKKLQKGYKHYSVLTQSNKVFSWGKIYLGENLIYNQSNPKQVKVDSPLDFSCGNSHTVIITKKGDAYALGDNANNQLGLYGEKFSKDFKKAQTQSLGSLIKVFCIGDCTFVVNDDGQTFFCGKYSNKKPIMQKFRQAEFTNEFVEVISISGSIGSYYLTNELGQIYTWQVDSMVKFKQTKQTESVLCRYVSACRGNIFKIKTLISPQKCTVKRITQQLKTYEEITFEIILRDNLGLFGVKQFVMPPRCQLVLSASRIKKQQILLQNRQFLKSCNFCSTSPNILLNQIMQSKFLDTSITRDSEEPWKNTLTLSIDSPGKYHFYIVMQETIIFEQQLHIGLSQRQKQLEQKSQQQKALKQQQKLRKAQLQKQRILEQKARKEAEEAEEEERRKETQRRAQEALRRHVKEQEEGRAREEQERKAKKELLTGGGFDLNKLKKKSMEGLSGIGTNGSGTNIMSSTFTEKPEKIERSQKLQKTSESFLPDINLRPSSRKKIVLPKHNDSLSSTLKDKPASIIKVGATDFSNTGFSLTASSKGQRGHTPKTKQQSKTIGVNGVTTLRNSVSKTTGSGIVKRGLSKKKPV